MKREYPARIDESDISQMNSVILKGIIQKMQEFFTSFWNGSRLRALHFSNIFQKVLLYLKKNFFSRIHLQRINKRIYFSFDQKCSINAIYVISLVIACHFNVDVSIEAKSAMLNLSQCHAQMIMTKWSTIYPLIYIYIYTNIPSSSSRFSLWKSSYNDRR